MTINCKNRRRYSRERASLTLEKMNRLFNPLLTACRFGTSRQACSSTGLLAVGCPVEGARRRRFPPRACQCEQGHRRSCLGFSCTSLSFQCINLFGGTAVRPRGGWTGIGTATRHLWQRNFLYFSFRATHCCHSSSRWLEQLSSALAAN